MDKREKELYQRVLEDITIYHILKTPDTLPLSIIVPILDGDGNADIRLMNIGDFVKRALADKELYDSYMSLSVQGREDAFKDVKVG